MDDKNYGSITCGRIVEAYYPYEFLKSLVYEGLDFGMDSIQVFPNQLDMTREFLRGHDTDMRISTVISYPYGSFTPEQKAYEIEDAQKHGADQFDVLINTVIAKARKWDAIRKEFSMCRKAAGDKILEIMLECEFMTQDELESICGLAIEEGIDRLTPSIGGNLVWGSRGEHEAVAEAEDIKTIKRICKDKVKCVAMGGIRTPERYLEMLDAGADYIACENAGDILRALNGGKNYCMTETW